MLPTFRPLKSLFLNSARMGKYIRMPLKSMTFTLNKEIINQENGIELNFTLEINMKKKHFSEEDHQFFS